MGKREHEESKRQKKSKRQHKNLNSDKSTRSKPTPEKQKVESPLEQIEDVLEGFEHEEEIVCDGEVELPLNATEEEDSANVDVEDGAEEDVEQLTSTPTQASPTPSKSNTSGKVSKKSTLKQNTTPPRSTNKTSSVSGSAATTGSNTNAANSINSSQLGTNAKKSKKNRRDSGTSSEEERWLTAIESGKLEDVDDELKKIKDPKLMTARQRAMYERQLDRDPPSPGSSIAAVELLMSLPNGYREKEKPITAEDIQKAALKSQKRKQQADEKREKDKKKTMERLLKKQESNKQRAAARSKISKTTQPMISYRNTLTGAYIQMPPEHEFPLAAQAARQPPKVQLCGITGCGQPKVYNCSKTNLPLCSYACYRKHVQAVRQIMC